MKFFCLLAAAASAAPCLTQEWAIDAEIVAPMVARDGYVWFQGNELKQVANTNHLGWSPKAAGGVTFKFDVAKAGKYTFQAELIAPNGNDNSFYVTTSVDHGTPTAWHTGKSIGWVWHKPPASTGMKDKYFPAGTHSITLKPREDGTKVRALKVTTGAGIVCFKKALKVCANTVCSYSNGQTIVNARMPHENWKCQKSGNGCVCECDNTFKCTLIHHHATGYKKSIHHCASKKQAVVVSAKKCGNAAGQLGTRFMVTPYGNRGSKCKQNAFCTSIGKSTPCCDAKEVCAESFCGRDIGSSSKSDDLLSYTASKTYCENKGARLCTLNEVYQCETCYTGCGHDNRMIWTSSAKFLNTKCPAGHYVVEKGRAGNGFTEKKTCKHASYKAYVRCCGDK